MLGLTVKEKKEFYITLATGNKTHMTLMMRKVVAANSTAVFTSWSMDTLALFTLLIQRFDLLKCRHGDQTTIPRKKEKKLKKSALSKHLLPVWKPELFGRHPNHVYHFWKILYFQMYQFSSKSLSGNAARRCLMICWMWSFRPPKIDSRPVGHTEVSAVRSSQQ